MLRGKELIDDINQCSSPPGELNLWWLGQASFIIKLGTAVLYLDPFLTPLKGRQVSPLLAPGVASNATLILGSHDHADHIDRPAWPGMAAASPQARFVLPEIVRADVARVTGLPPGRLIGLDDGRSIEAGGVRITGIAAAHELLNRDPETGAYPCLGFVVEGHGCTLYHSGDCCLYEGLQTKLRRWKFDLMLLPINGRDAVRLKAGCIGNMTYQEAADLAGALSPRVTIPMHYDMFAMNPGDPQAFVDYMAVKYPNLATRVCRHGARTVISNQ